MSKSNDNFMNPPVFCRVVAGASPTFALTRGCSAVARPAAGRHRVNLSDGIPTASVMVQLTREATAHGSISYQAVDANTIDVYTFDNAGAAADVNFTMSVSRNGF